MAKHLARIHGTEEDKVNCPFYFKIGACRHADRCSRLHHKPAFSPTILIKHVYRHPNATGSSTANQDPSVVMEDFLVFFEDMFMELSKFGHIEGLHVVDNVGDHMIGHVYVKFSDEEEAADAIEKLHGRYYDGIVLDCEYSPVTDFREARCRDYDEETCSRAGFCNFLHVKPVPAALIRSLEEDAETQRRLKLQEEEDEKRLLKKQHKRSKRKHDEGGSHKRSKRSRRSRSRSSSVSEGSNEEDRRD
jgi:splicing factor U2AF 35 kDa subunit